MSDYDLRDSLNRAGFDYTVDGRPIEDLDWKVTEAAADEVIVDHPAGTAVHLRQQKPMGGDLPFRAVRVDEHGEEHQLGEGDWVDRILTPAIAYMRGYAERSR